MVQSPDGTAIDSEADVSAMSAGCAHSDEKRQAGKDLTAMEGSDSHATISNRLSKVALGAEKPAATEDAPSSGTSGSQQEEIADLEFSTAAASNAEVSLLAPAFSLDLV